jgi:hypothetical protein
MKKGHYCPLLKKDCIEIKCEWYTQVRGINPNTGQEVDDWQCAVNLLPVLLIENSAQQRSTSAAVESFRNESVKRSDAANVLLCHMAQKSPPTIEAVTISELSLPESQG